MEALATKPKVEIGEQEYAHSNRGLFRYGGARAVEATTSLELEQHQEAAYADYESALTEMLRTDPEFNKKLDIDNERKHQIIDDQVCDKDGTPMVEILERGWEASSQLAKGDSDYEALAIRDGGDVITAEIVDQLKPGETYIAFSMQPIKELKSAKLGKKYKGLGYREGLLYIQVYSKTEDELVAGDYSVDQSDEATWRQLLAEKGINIPEDADPNTFIRYGHKISASPEEAKEMALEMRRDYYKRCGVTGRRFSVSEYVKQNAPTVKGSFEAYYSALADAVYSGENNDVMQNFAKAINGLNIKKLKPEVKSNLIKVANSSRFDHEASKTMDSVLRYAVVEELRKGLKDFINPKAIDRQAQEEWKPLAKTVEYTAAYVNRDDVHHVNHLLASNLAAGINAGRGYGGCPAVDLTEEGGEVDDFGNNPQSAYGGKNKDNIYDRLNDDCEFVSKECPECHTKNVKTKVTKTHISGSCGCSKKR